MRQLLSPADDTASRTLVNVQTAATRVKELVTEGVSKGWGESELTAKLNAAIAAECRKIDNLGLREQLKKSLVTAARKWHYELSMTYRVLDNNLARETQRQPLNLNIRNLLSKSPYEKMVEFRKVLDDGTSPAIPVIKDYQRSVKLAMKAMSAEPPKMYSHTGKPIPIRLRAEMAARYAAAVENLQQLINSGVKFCWISSHPNCSPRCKDFQGKLYSLFQGTVVIGGKEYGESGTIDGVHYEPINSALAGPKGDGNGCISGYNCRHRAIEYTRGSLPPADFSEAEIKREYAVDKQQRAYENQIRQLKMEERQLRACGMTKEAAALRKHWRKLTVDYQIYSMEHDRAFYPYRCVIDETELPQGTLDNPQENDIIVETGFEVLDKAERLIDHNIDDCYNTTNPHFSEGEKYQRNCQRCVAAYDARRRGYDVTASERILDGTDTLPYTYHREGWANVYRDGLKSLEVLSGNRSNVVMQSIQQRMTKYGDGARAIVQVHWQSGGGHVFIAEQINGVTQFIDPQAGVRDCSFYFNAGMIRPKETRLLRIDDKKFTDLIKKCIST